MRSILALLLLAGMALFAPCYAADPTPSDIAALKEKAEQGDSEAWFQLGYQYAIGQGMKQDWTEAYFWYSLDRPPVYFDSAAKHLTPEQRTEIDKRVQMWRQVHPLAGTPPHHSWRVDHNECIEKGFSEDFGTITADRRAKLTAQEKTERDSLITQAEQGDQGAASKICSMYGFSESGIEFARPEDTVVAKWCQKAAAQGDSQAMLQLGLFYRDGRGVEKDYAAAYKWLRMVAETTSPWGSVASCALAYMYAEGQGVKQDWMEAYFWGTLRGNHDGVRRAAAIHLTQPEIIAAQQRVDSQQPMPVPTSPIHGDSLTLPAPAAANGK